MSEQDLIREQVVAQAGTSGISDNFNVQNIANVQGSLNSLADSGRRALGVEEKAKRRAAEELAAGQVVKGMAHLSEFKNSYDIALSQTSDPKEIAELAKEWEAEARESINEENFTSQVSQDIMNKYLTQNGPTLFKNAAELRITAVNRADTIANFEIGISQAKKNYLIDDKVFKAKLKPLYNELYSMGVISKEQARQRLIIDMEQKKRGQAEFITAGFQTELNSFAAAANTETAKLWNEYVKEGFMNEKVGFNVQDGIEKNLISKTDELTKQYKEDIKKLKLTLPEERQLFRALDEDAGFRKRYLGSIKKQVQDAHKLQEANSLEAFQVEQIQDPMKRWTLPELQQKGLAHDDIVDYNKTLIKKTYDFSVFTKDTENLTSANALIKNLSPESGADDRLKATKMVAAIKNPTLKAQVLNNLQEKIDPKKFYEPMNQGFTAWETEINNLFAEGDLAEIGELDLTKFPDQGSGTEGLKQMFKWGWEVVTPENSEPITELQLAQAIQSVKDEHKRIWRLEGEKVARVYLSERKIELQEGMSMRKFQQYYIDPQKSNKEIIILEGVSYYNYIDPETGEKILEPVGK